MTADRETVCRTTSEQLTSGAGRLAVQTATIGLDGFVDEIVTVVDKRVGPADFVPVKTLAALGGKIAAAAGQSTNLELIVRCVKLGGNGPIMANALANFGVQVNYIGNLGLPAPHPVFEPLAARTNVVSIGDPGHTDALEFEDGKLMLGKHRPLAEITWERLVERVGRDSLAAMIAGSELVGLLNWTMLPAMSAIWRELILAKMFGERHSGQRLFIDLCDPDKRTEADLAEALELLVQFQSQVDVVLGLNLREARAVGALVGVEAPEHPSLDVVEDLARRLRERLGLALVVVHPRSGAAAASAEGSAHFSGPFSGAPKISTGGGDHFNAGFAAGLMLDMSLTESLCLGVATSGVYVRTAESPTLEQLAQFIGSLPPPIPEGMLD